MAAFDQSAPQPLTGNVEGQWLGWPKPTTTPEPNKAGEFLGKAIGTAVQGAAEIGHGVVENQAQGEATDILRGQISNLQGVQQDLLHPNTQESSPPEVQRSQDTAEMLSSARANGAISPTYYYGQLDKLSKDMSSKYPMYAEAVRKGIANATGVTHTANELYQSTLRDINSFLTHKNEDQNKALNEIASNMGSGPALGAANAADAWERVRSGKWTPAQGMAYANAVQSRKFQLGNLREEITTADALGQNQSKMAERVWQGEANNIVAQHVHAITDRFGFKTIGDMQYAIQHPEQFSSVDMNAVVSAYASEELNIRKELEAKANEMHKVVNPQTGKTEVWSYAQLHTGYQANNDTALKTYHAGLELAKDKDVGSLSYLSRNVAAAETDATAQLLKQEGIGNSMLNLSALKKYGMPDYVNQMVQDSLKAGLVPQMKDYLDATKGRSWMTPGQAQQNGLRPATSMQDDIDAFIKKMGVKSPKVFNNLVEDLHGLTQPTVPDEQKAAKILYTFGPKNAGVLSTWNRNGVQPDGTVSNAPDRWNILGAMTDPKITAEVRRLDADPRFKRFQLWDNYKSTVSNMVRTEFQKQVLDLESFDAGKNVAYHTDKHEFVYTGISSLGQTPTGAATAPRTGVREGNNPVQRLLDKLNIGMHTMASIAEAEGSQPDIYAYTMMKDMGYDFSGTKIQGASTGQGMMNSIIATHAAERKKYEDDLNKMIEEVKGLGKKKKE